jgi:hypothetical protein
MDVFSHLIRFRQHRSKAACSSVGSGPPARHSAGVGLVFAAGLILFAAGCGDTTGPGICTAQYVYGLNVEVRDALSHEPAADGATITASDGAYVDTLRVMPDGLLALGAGERAGVYTLTIRKPGYQVWESIGIRVDRDRCHVHPVVVQAGIQPLGKTVGAAPTAASRQRVTPGAILPTAPRHFAGSRS